MFKLTGKQMVANKVKKLYGADKKPMVIGIRPEPLSCVTLAIPNGHYYVEAQLNNKSLGNAHHRNWRRAYKLLEQLIEVNFIKELETSNA